MHKSKIEISKLRNINHPNNKSWSALVEYLPNYFRQHFANTLSQADIEDATQQTAQIVFKYLDKIETVKYIESVAHSVGLKMIEQRKRQEEKNVPLEGCVESFDNIKADVRYAKELNDRCIEESFANQAMLDAKDRFIEVCMHLSKDHQTFLNKYSVFLAKTPPSRTERQDFAHAYGYTESNVNIIFHRIRKRLESLNVKRN